MVVRTYADAAGLSWGVPHRNRDICYGVVVSHECSVREEHGTR